MSWKALSLLSLSLSSSSSSSLSSSLSLVLLLLSLLSLFLLIDLLIDLFIYYCRGRRSIISADGQPQQKPAEKGAEPGGASHSGGGACRGDLLSEQPCPGSHCQQASPSYHMLPCHMLQRQANPL